MKKATLFITAILMTIAGLSVAQVPEPIVENFETGDFSLFEWQNDSIYPWVIDTINPYEGLYCMKSGNAGQHNSASAIQVSVDIPEDCIMSFYSQISAGWNDLGNFYIDGELMNTYSCTPMMMSSWGRKVFDVTAGTHVFKWEYTKDDYNDYDDDCFYIDSITFYQHLELPLHGWHSYCGSDFNNALGNLGVGNYRIATRYPTEMLARYVGTSITKVAVFSDTLYNAVYGDYTCSIWFGGETPQSGMMVSTTSFHVPASLNEWVEFELEDPVVIPQDMTVWVVYEIDRQSASAWPLGMCNDIDPDGNGNWYWTGVQWEQLQSTGDPHYGDWTVKTYFSLEETQDHDVYYSGNGNGIGKVWKNNDLLYSLSDSTNIQLKGIQVADDGTVYGAGYANDTTGIRGRVWVNDSCVFTADTNTYFDHITLNGNDWTVAGFNNVWQNGELLYSYSHGEDECHIQGLAIDETTGDIYAGGIISVPGEYHAYASVWKNDSLLWMEDTISSVQSICYDGESLYAAGYKIENDSLPFGVIWQNDSIIYQIENANFGRIAAFDGSLYWTGFSLADTVFRIWQDGEVLYTLPELSGISNLAVNENGVYYTDAQTVYKDGEVLYQPECIITDLVVKPAPPQPEYTITLESANPEWGSVGGGGTYTSGSTATLYAIPNIGCEFVTWDDGDTHNPRDIVVMQDSTFIASFARSQYTIDVVSDHPAWGSVTGGGTYYYGDTITISATAHLGFAFIGWSDGVYTSPRTVVVTENHTYTARFEIRQCVISTAVYPENSGTVNGGGTYNYGETIHLTAHSNTGYVFSQWDDGNITNPRSVFVEGDATYTAVFTPLQYEITTEADPVEGGTVTGAGVYDYGSTATLTATPNANYMFICWNDGTVSNPRTVTVTGNATYKALFYLNGTPQYTITVMANDPELGTVTGSGTYPEGATIEISATPNENVAFNSWDDGNTDNPRSVTVTGDMTFTALFEVIPPVETYTITVRTADPLLGTVYGGGIYQANTAVTIGAIPAQGYFFAGWQDGNVDNPRTIIVTGDAEYIASFSQNPAETYTVTVLYDETQGFVLGAGTYNAGATATLAAIPADDYMFARWSDGTTDNPKEIIVDHDITLAAFFNYTSVDENGESKVSLYPNPASDVIRLEGLEGVNDIQIYNAMGVLVKAMSLNGEEEINVSELPAGIYLIRVNAVHTIRFVKE